MAAQCRGNCNNNGKSIFTAEDAENAEELQLQVLLEKLLQLKFPLRPLRPLR